MKSKDAIAKYRRQLQQTIRNTAACGCLDCLTAHAILQHAQRTLGWVLDEDASLDGIVEEVAAIAALPERSCLGICGARAHAP